MIRYTLAAICLHNYLRETGNARYCPMGFVDCRDDTGRIQPGEWRRIVALDAGCSQQPQPAHGTLYKNETTKMRNDWSVYLKREVGSIRIMAIILCT